ncbi:MAG: BTAD domain-containing putative transcriptional regulator [Actinoplanes sp.]
MPDAPSGSPLRFEILGAVRALRGDEPVDLGPAKQRAVLAVLLLHAGQPVPTHQIVDAVWGEGPPENGANVVQKYVAGLRRTLEPERSPRTPGELLALTNGGYVLRADPGALDADVFQSAVSRASAEQKAGRLAEAADALRKALALWRGEALSGLGGPAFDAARARLADARATAWEKWADIELARGHHTALMPDLVRLVDEFPLREGLRAQLMIALHQGGRQAEALAAFRDARAYFLEEFGVEPGERMQETHKRILRGEPFYSEPVDPWADSDDIPGPRAPMDNAPHTPAPPPAPSSPPAPYVQQYVPPDATEIVPSSGGFIPPLPPPGPGSWSGTPGQPSYPPPSRDRIPVGEVIFAALVPIIVCSFGSWIYFVYAGAHRHDRRQFIAAAGYGALFLVAFVFAAIDPTPVDSPDLSNAEWIGFTLFAGIAIASAVHGAVVASHPGDTRKNRTLRGQARQYVAFDPARARQMGIGRPDLMRVFDDGGLVDLNHAPGQELARLPGLTPQDAHRIVIDRFDRGPYAQPEDLIMRGLVSSRTLRRVGTWLVCIPPAHPARPSPWTSPSAPPRH